MDHSCPTPPHQVGYRRTKYWHNLPGGGVGQETRGGGWAAVAICGHFGSRPTATESSFLFFGTDTVPAASHGSRSELQMGVCSDPRWIRSRSRRSPVARGPWPVARGPWPVARGPWPVARGPWSVARGPWPVARGPWPVARGPWPGARGPWPVALGTRPVARSLWPVARGPRPVARGL
jgi:hypothetical protein